MRPALTTACLILAASLAAVPAAAGSRYGEDHRQCAACHDPGSGTDGKLPGAGTCLGCHDNLGGSDSSGHVVPAGMYRSMLPQGGKAVLEHLDCLTCHNPHSDNRFATVLRERKSPAVLSVNTRVDRISMFCTGCHEDMGRFGGMAQAYSRHPIGLPAEVVHESHLPLLPLVDVQGTDDPSDDVIACTTCHFVHNGPNQYLLRWDRSIEREVCGQCHIEGRQGDGITDARRIARLR